jgi:hypothetical protein
MEFTPFFGHGDYNCYSDGQILLSSFWKRLEYAFQFLITLKYSDVSQDSSIGIATAYGLDGLGVGV